MISSGFHGIHICNLWPPTNGATSAQRCVHNEDGKRRTRTDRKPREWELDVCAESIQSVGEYLLPLRAGLYILVAEAPAPFTPPTFLAPHRSTLCGSGILARAAFRDRTNYPLGEL